jgi:uncharacterized membrane protein
VRRVVILCLSVLALLTSAQPIRAGALSYSFTSIDYPGALGTQVKGINNAGSLVGSYSETVDVGDANTRLHAFLLDKDGFHTIDQSDTVDTHVQAITESGTIAGFIGDYDQRCCASTHITGYVTKHGETTFLENKGLNMFVQDANDRGDVIGFSHGGNGTGPGFIWNSGELTEVDAQPGGSTYLVATSEPPVIIGGAGGNPMPFTYRQGEFEDLILPSSMHDVGIRGTNNRGDLVGAYTNDNGQRLGYLLRQGEITEITFPGADGTVPYEVTDNGIIAGEYYKNGVTHGFVATPH